MPEVEGDGFSVANDVEGKAWPTSMEAQQPPAHLQPLLESTAVDVKHWDVKEMKLLN